MLISGKAEGQMKLVTVVVSVYMTKDYLEACVQSILEQTYENLEIILVNDGSPDDSGRLCDELCKKNSRIKVIHQENMGLSGARNTALDIMRGDMVTFVDSDDTISSTMIEYLVQDIEQYDADIAECQFYDVFNDKVNAVDYLKITKVYTPEEAMLIDLSSKGGAVAACGKLYRKEIFKEHRFEVGRLGEDTFAIIESLRHAKRVVIDHRPMYYYYHRMNSITTNFFDEKTLDAIKGAKRNLKIVEKEFPGAIPGAMFRYDWSYLWVLDRILLGDDWKTNKYIRGMLRHVRKHLIRIMRSPYFTKSRKIGAVLISVSPAVYRCLVLYVWNKRWN